MALAVSEAAIQAAVMHYLSIKEKQGQLYFFRSNSFAHAFDRRDGSRGFINSAKAGLPDIICVSHGVFYGLELKTAKGIQSETQKAAQSQIEACGGQYHIVRSVEDVARLFP